MRALVKYAPGKGHVAIREVPVRPPKEDDLLIKVKYCGICGTDLHIYADEFPNTPPVIMGHEYCGTVVQVGEAVRDAWRVGERVVGELHTGACGTCDLCRAGKPHICAHKLASGLQIRRRLCGISHLARLAGPPHPRRGPLGGGRRQRAFRHHRPLPGGTGQPGPRADGAHLRRGHHGADGHHLGQPSGGQGDHRLGHRDGRGVALPLGPRLGRHPGGERADGRIWAGWWAS
jgi:hypothetical protein